MNINHLKNNRADKPMLGTNTRQYSVREYVYLLIGLLMIITIVTTGFLWWQLNKLTKVEQLANKYHLSTMLNSTSIKEEARHLSYHIYQKFHQDRQMKEKVDDHFLNLHTSFFIMKGKLDFIKDLQHQYNHNEYANTLKNADNYLSQLLVDEKKVDFTVATDIDKILKNLDQLNTFVDQLLRQHTIAYEDLRSNLLTIRKKTFQRIFIFIFIFGIIGLFVIYKIFYQIKMVEEELDKHRTRLQGQLDEQAFELIEVNKDLNLKIEERKLAEEALLNEKIFINLTIDSLPGIFYLFTSDGKFLRWNQSFEKVSGYTADEISTMHPLDFFLSEEQAFVEERIKEVFEKGRSFVEAYWLNKRDEKTLYYLTGNRVDIDGTPCQVGMGIDINDRRIAEEKRDKLQAQLNQSQKMESIGTLAGGIAHDFNNILFPIVGYTEMLIEDVPKDSLLRGSLNAIFTSAIRARELVKQILTFSRQDGTELILMKMQPIIKEALKLIRSTIPTTIKIQQNIQNDCGVIKADPIQIHQIIMNLATNAYHAMEKSGGELTVSLKEVKLSETELISQDMMPGVYARLIIADTGMGMDKTTAEKIFDPFFTTKGVGKGTGMGLSVVHGIILSVNGAIKVNTKPGKGAEFHIYLPVVKNSYEKQGRPSKEPIQGGTERILLVDDETSIISMEKHMLKRLGYHVTSHQNSIRALETFQAKPNSFDIVITDMAMPNMSGDKLSSELVKIRSDIPILLCTGFSEIMSEEKASLLGIKGFLFKPIVMKDLALKIREVLENN